MTERLCVLCKHFYFSGGSPGYSEYTPGTEMSMGCELNIWPSDLGYDATEADFRRFIRTAETCEKWDPETGEESK